jgi:hypothetical protein
LLSLKPVADFLKSITSNFRTIFTGELFKALVLCLFLTAKNGHGFLTPRSPYVKEKNPIKIPMGCRKRKFRKSYGIPTNM